MDRPALDLYARAATPVDPKPYASGGLVTGVPGLVGEQPMERFTLRGAATPEQLAALRAGWDAAWSSGEITHLVAEPNPIAASGALRALADFGQEQEDGEAQPITQAAWAALTEEQKAHALERGDSEAWAASYEASRQARVRRVAAEMAEGWGGAPADMVALPRETVAALVAAAYASPPSDLSAFDAIAVAEDALAPTGPIAAHQARRDAKAQRVAEESAVTEIDPVVLERCVRAACIAVLSTVGHWEAVKELMAPTEPTDDIPTLPITALNGHG